MLKVSYSEGLVCLRPHFSFSFSPRCVPVLRAYVLMLLYVSSCYYICVLMLRYIFVLMLLCTRTIYVTSHYCMCPHTTELMSPRRLYMCPHPAECVSSYYYVSSHYYMCLHTAIYVSSYYCICVLMLLYKCPHTTI
jgi:hypothetical protein